VEGETLNLSVSAGRDCYLYVMSFGANGSTTVLLPSRQSPGANFLTGGKTYRLFRDIGGDFDMVASPPYGQETVKAFASTVQLGSLLSSPAGDASGLIPALRRAAAEWPVAAPLKGGARGYAERSLVLTTTRSGR
jgi:hypothetical protein